MPQLFHLPHYVITRNQSSANLISQFCQGGRLHLNERGEHADTFARRGNNPVSLFLEMKFSWLKISKNPENFLSIN